MPSASGEGLSINSSEHTAHQPSGRTAAHVPQTQYLTAPSPDCSRGQPPTHTHIQLAVLKDSDTEGRDGNGLVADGREPSSTTLLTYGTK